jgi:hypothetical protein
MNPTLYVGLITWGPEHSDFDEYIILTSTEVTAKRELVRELIRSYDAAPSVYGDEAPIFMEGDENLGAGKEFLPDTATEPELTEWLEGFRESTTAPWWTVNERQVIL